MKYFILLLLVLLPIKDHGQVIRVAIAADAQFVARKLAADFEKKTAIRVEVIPGSSGNLTALIENGAPYDIFLSADMHYPEKLYKAGFALEKPKIYAFGKLVLWSINERDLSKGIQIVLSPDIHTIAIANPKFAPYGLAAVEALTKSRLYNTIKSKIVLGENIGQVDQYLLSNVTDLAFTAKSIVKDPAMKDKGKWVEVDDTLYKPIAQGVIILKYPKGINQIAAKKFYRFLFSPAAKNIFTLYGYKIKSNEQIERKD